MMSKEETCTVKLNKEYRLSKADYPQFFTTTLNQPLYRKIFLQFPDGEQVDLNCQSLTEFMGKMNRLHEFEKENAKLRELLKKCRVAFETYAREDESCGLDEDNKYAKHLLIKINEVLK